MVNTASKNIRRPIPISVQSDIEQFTPRDGSIIDDVLRRVLEMKPDFGASLIAQVSKEAHQDWAGDRPYISTNGGADYKSKRDQRILADWQRGERIPLLVRRHQLSERRIRQIIFGK